MIQKDIIEEIDTKKLQPVVSLNNTIDFITKRLPQLTLKYDRGQVYNEFFRRVMLKRISGVKGDLESIKTWAKDTVGKEINEIKTIKSNLKKNKKAINEKSKEVYSKAKEECETIKKGTALKIKYMYKKAREGDIEIPMDDAATIKTAERLIDTFDIKKARNAKKDAFKIAKKIILQKNEPKGTKVNIDTNADIGADTSPYFGATLGTRLEKFENTNKKNYKYLLLILIPIIIYIVINVN